MTKSEIEFLKMTLHYNGNAMGLITGRRYRLRTAEALYERGLLDREWGAQCDGDGFLLQPERYRWSYSITPEGMDALNALEERS
jgi:hypothetical protein